MTHVAGEAITADISERISEVNSVSDGLGPMARWEIARDDPGTVEEMFQRAAEGERLKGICRSKGWPYAVVAVWVSGQEELVKRLELARRIWAEDMALETVAIADGNEENVPAAKHRTDVRFKLAGFLDRARFGDQVQHNVTVDGFGEMLRRVSERKLAEIKASQQPAITERVINEIPAEPEAA